MTGESTEQDWTKRILEHSNIFVKRDSSVRELVLKTGISAYSDNPLNLFLEGPSSIGKTNAVKNIIVPYFPEKDVWLLGGLSPTALIHDYGVLIDLRTRKEIDLDEKPTKEAFTIKRGKAKIFDKEGYAKAQKEWRETLRNAAHLVNLRNKIMVFLEAPHLETYARLRPILSHDVKEISYKVTDKTKGGGLRTVHTILRDWPATIFLTTETKHTQELSTRSLSDTPDMTEEKYHEANKLSGDIASKPWRYSAKNDPELKAIKAHIMQIAETSKSIAGVIIPYGDLVGDKFSAKVPSDMRHCTHFLSLIEQNAILNLFNRPVLRIDNDIQIMAVLQDLEVTTQLYANISGPTSLEVPRHILNFYRDVFLQVEKDVLGLDEEDDSYGRITVNSLVVKHNLNSNNKMSSDTVYVYLKRLKEKGIIDSKTDPYDKRHQLYFSLGKHINSLDSLSKEVSSLFNEMSLEKWLKGEIDYLTKIEGVKEILFALSLGDLNHGNFINLLDEESSSLILVRYFKASMSTDTCLKTENKPKNSLPLDSKIKSTSEAKIAQ